MNSNGGRHHAVCPFCSLLCDDLIVTDSGDQLAVSGSLCPKASQGFGQVRRDHQPRVHGRDVALDTAIEQAAEILTVARQPLVTGIGTDVAGARAAVALAERSGAVIDHGSSQSTFFNIAVVQSRGWITTTLAEVRNRADLIVFVGTDTTHSYPRFVERCLRNKRSLVPKNTRQRQITFLGDAKRLRNSALQELDSLQKINCSKNELPEALNVLKASLHGFVASDSHLATHKLKQISKLADRIAAACYSVFVWSAAELPDIHAEHCIRTVTEIIGLINRNRRAAGLPLGGSNGLATLQNVCAWQTGYPQRVNFATGAADYDPFLYDAQRMLAEVACDAVVWISSIDPVERPPQIDSPKIVLSDSANKYDHCTEVYIPVGTPGVDHTGNLFRTDGVVSLPLYKLRACTYPSVADVLTAITDKL